jgi:type II secretory pathway pseudopilin PulG
MRKIKIRDFDLSGQSGQSNHAKSRGFTLMEVLVYVGVFSVASVFLTNILLTVTDISTRESASREVSSQLDTTLKTIQQLIQQSSNIESATGSTLKLRMTDPLKDPTCITLDSGAIKIAQGPNGADLDACSTTKIALTTDKVTADILDFTKIDNIQYSAEEGKDLVGHSVVNINMGLSYKTTNLKYKISRTLTSAVGRVSAATFDSDLLPDSTNSRSIGSSGLKWKYLNVSDTASFAGNVGITGTLSASRYTQTATGIPIVNLGSPTVTEMALFQEQFSNKSEFYPIANLTFETFDGTTWTDVTSSISDINKKKFVGGDAGTGILIPNGVQKYRISIRNKNAYVYLNALYMYWSGSGHTAQFQIWKKRDDSVDWVQQTSSTVQVSGWPSHLYMPFPSIAWSLSSTAGHFNDVRIEITPTWNASYPANNITLYKLQLWGGYPAGKRTIYSVDENQSVGFPANVGIGTTTPQNKLDIEGGAVVGATYSGINVAPANGLLIEGNVGIGVTSPGYKLDVVSGGATTARLGTAAGDTVIIGGGSGKLTVGTVDPLFDIDGKQYATYTPGMTGVKEETAGVLRLRNIGDDRLTAEIDFASVTNGSDLWVFRNVTDFGEEWGNLGVLLTPGFIGNVSYKKDAQNNRILIAGSADGADSDFEVSYRLTAPRFDHLDWLNIPKDSEQGSGLKVR